MAKPSIAVVSFPGNNCEVESLRSIRNSGMEAVFFRWNDDRAKLKDVDGYFIPGGFSYEDRGRSGMVAGRDPLMDFIGREAEDGKVVIGNCNGAQILVESGLIPLGGHLDMALARNVIQTKAGADAPGFLSEWVWITPTCAHDRCATSDWSGPMHLPIAHGEGRFTTKDADVIAELRKNDQLAFSYCDAEGKVSEDPIVTPNGSMFAVAGICNLAGNVIALMPHPERTSNGDPYFLSLKCWIEKEKRSKMASVSKKNLGAISLGEYQSSGVEIFIATIITNNEERTVEQAARRVHPKLTLKQLRYLSPSSRTPGDVLSTISIFNPNKEIAYIRRGTSVTCWNAQTKSEDEVKTSPLSLGIKLLRREEPDTGSQSLGKGSMTGICYILDEISEQELYTNKVLEVFSNPHASTLQKLI